MTRLLLALAPALLLALPTRAQDPEVRPAAAILRDFQSVRMPGNSGGGDADSVRRFREAIERGSAKKAALALELFVGHPDHPRVPELMDIRWACLNNVRHDYPAVVVETTMVLEREGTGAELRHAALRARMRAIIHSDLATNRERIEAVRDLVAVHPRDEYAGMGMLDIVQGHLASPEAMRPLLELAVKRWPDNPYVGRRARPWIAALDLLGEELAGRLPEASRAAFAAAMQHPATFTVVRLWAGRVYPSSGAAELEALRSLQEEFGQDVRVLGLVNGDLAELLPALRQAGVDWPQVEAKADAPWRSPLGAGLSACYFVLDRQGRIVGVVGRAESAAARVRQLRR